MQDVMVSIYVPTYNHENYIVRALDSIRMQQTKYSYEVFVGEDCSTDNTRAVLKEWEAANADERFTILYREQNLHNTDCRNALDLKRRCTGKYIICLEGDDFWTDPLKLEKQVSFLETHPEYIAVAHNCTVVGEDSEPNGETYPECKDAEYTLRHFANDILPGQYTTLLARNYMYCAPEDAAFQHLRQGPGDRRVYFMLTCRGRVYCMQESMSAYRHVTSGGSSFSATTKYRYETLRTYNLSFVEYAYAIGHREAIRYAEMLYVRNIRYALRTRRINLKTAWTDLGAVRHKLRPLWMLLRRDVNRFIFRKEVAA